MQPTILGFIALLAQLLSLFSFNFTLFFLSQLVALSSLQLVNATFFYPFSSLLWLFFLYQKRKILPGLLSFAAKNIAFSLFFCLLFALLQETTSEILILLQIVIPLLCLIQGNHIFIWISAIIFISKIAQNQIPENAFYVEIIALLFLLFVMHFCFKKTKSQELTWDYYEKLVP